MRHSCMLRRIADTLNDPMNLQNLNLNSMLWLLIGILFLLWIFAIVIKYTLGGLIHILLIIAIIMGITRLFRGRRTPKNVGKRI